MEKRLRGVQESENRFGEREFASLKAMGLGRQRPTNTYHVDVIMINMQHVVNRWLQQLDLCHKKVALIISA